MKNVELVRARVVRGLAKEMTALRVWISSCEGNEDAVNRLADERARAELLALMCDSILMHLGHEPPATPVASNTQTRRLISKRG